jgi:hypothetical protein
MAKVFYTEHDIEDMVNRGQRSLEVGDNVVLTDLAYEKARSLGMQLLEPNQKPPAAPVRPYLSKPALSQPAAQVSPASSNSGGSSSARLDAIKARVKTAVKAQLGSQVDDAMLDRIIERVAADLGLK